VIARRYFLGHKSPPYSSGFGSTLPRAADLSRAKIFFPRGFQEIFATARSWFSTLDEIFRGPPWVFGMMFFIAVF
jgi:hypothetical protein